MGHTALSTGPGIGEHRRPASFGAQRRRCCASRVASLVAGCGEWGVSDRLSTVPGRAECCLADWASWGCGPLG
eukprot:4442897-Alexandrium_andersonii.AAC.1